MNSHVAADQYNEWVVKVLKKVIKKTYSNKQFENISRQSAAITGISEVRPCTVVYREREINIPRKIHFVSFLCWYRLHRNIFSRTDTMNSIGDKIFMRFRLII